MYLMTTIRILLIAVSFLIPISAFSQVEGPEWRQKPVQCGNAESAMEIIQEAGEKALVGGFSNIKMPNGQNSIQPFYLFINTDTGTFTILEYHTSSDEVCILGYGNGIDFDVQKLFEPKFNS